MSVVYMVVLALAGLGVLLYGMTLFSRAFETVLGSRFSRSFTRVANNSFSSYLVGSGMTFLTQKVTLVCGMVMGFVDVGTVTFRQSIAFILGISFGSALSMILMMFQGFSLTLYLTLFCLIGAFLTLFFTSSKARNIGQALMGFGMLFLGIELVGTYAGEIFALPSVYNFLSAISSPLVVIIIGLVISFLTTSTFASLTVLVALVGATGAGPISIETAFLGMLAVGVGSALSDWVYTFVGQSIEAKRVITFHLIFRIFSFLALFWLYFTPFISMLNDALGGNVTMTLIIVHMIQMTIPSLILLPFNKYLALMMEKIMPGKKSRDDKFSAFTLPDSAMSVFSVGYPSLLKSTKNLLELCLETQNALMLRIVEKKDTRGLSGKLKGLNKVIKITSNNAIRLSSKAGEKQLPKLNVLLNILNDILYLDGRLSLLYTEGTDIVKKTKTLSESHEKDLIKIFDEIKNLYALDIDLIESLMNGENVDNKVLKSAMESNKRVFSLCQKVKKGTFAEYKKTGHYSRNNNVFFSIVSVCEDINADLVNIAVKLGVLSG